MHQCKKYAIELLICCFLALNTCVYSQKDIRKYSCEDYSQLVLIATLDGSLTAIEAKSGIQCWKTFINKDSFMSSSLSKFKIYENDKRIWIVPSLDGNLFTYDGSYITPLFINVDSLLSTSATIDSKASIVGGKLKSFHGINRHTGEIFYKCNMLGCDYAPVQSSNVLNIEEISQTVNAFDFLGKRLSWHFRIGELSIKAGNSGKISMPSQSSTFLIGSDHEPSSVLKSIKISLHSGFVAMANEKAKFSWIYQTFCPVLDVWYVSGKNVYLLDPFHKDTEFFPFGDFDALSSSRLFLGTYKNQFFLKISREPVLKSQYSSGLSTKVAHRDNVILALREAYMPYWNRTNSSMCFDVPDNVPAIFTDSVNVSSVDDYSHEYGSYFYINQTVEVNATHCIVHNYIIHNKATNRYAWFLGCLSVAFLMGSIIILFYGIFIKQEELEEVPSTVDVKLVETQTDVTTDKMSEENSEIKDTNYFSRFHEDFELLSVLGKGGFGVVMEVKNKIDDCHYAVKRIGVPDLMKNKDQQEKVMREVRALAKLDHPGIVRYYNSWIENPPVGWQENKDAELNVCDVSSEVAQETSSLSLEKNKLSKKLKFNSRINYKNIINSSDVLLKKDKERSDFSSGGVDFLNDVSSEVPQGTASLSAEKHKLSKKLKFNPLRNYENSLSYSDALLEKDNGKSDFSSGAVDFLDDLSSVEKSNLSEKIKCNSMINYMNGLNCSGILLKKDEQRSDFSSDGVAFPNDVSSEVPQETAALSVEKHKLSENKFNPLMNYVNSLSYSDAFLEKDNERSDFSSGGVDFRDSAPSLKHESGMMLFNFTKPESKKNVDFSFAEAVHDNSEASSKAAEEAVIESIDTSYLYIQMQLCKKENLSNWLKMHLNRDYNTVIVYFTQLVDAMEYVHRSGIMHRDLKPSNIYFSMDGTIKIGDFGLATSSTTPQNGRVIDMNEWSSHTRGCGTKLYMSPEQSENKHYDLKTDIFSLGLILFELLEPFSTFSERYMVMMEVRCLRIPSEFMKRYPSESELLKEMLASDPKERPTALEIKKHPLFCAYFSHEVD